MKRTILTLTAIALAAGIVYAQKAPQGDEYKQWMQDVRQSILGFNNAYNDMNMANAKEAVDIMADIYAKMEAHWEAQGKADAAELARESKEYMLDAQRKMELDDIAYTLNLIELTQKNCKPCHDAYRP